jgi:hypothetical protein
MYELRSLILCERAGVFGEELFIFWREIFTGRGHAPLVLSMVDAVMYNLYCPRGIYPCHSTLQHPFSALTVAASAGKQIVVEALRTEWESSSEAPMGRRSRAGGTGAT